MNFFSKLTKIFVLALVLAFSPRSHSQSPSLPSEEIKALKTDNHSLREAITKLQQIVEQQRKIIVQQQANAQSLKADLPPALAGPRNSEPTPRANVQADHWLTLSSGIRHNKKCSAFQTTKGRLCDKVEGIPCRKCGG